MTDIRNFASDNNSGVHPNILNAISNVNINHAIAYGDDQITNEAIKIFKDHFGSETEVFFVFNGTAANTIALKTITEPFNSIICSENSHINYDECNAPERFTGCKLVPVKPIQGKIYPNDIEKHLFGFGDPHHSQPKVISITQATEFGTVYNPEEIKNLAKLAKKYDLLIHLDGARIANSSVYLGKSFREFTFDIGVDVISFGGTKNGMMFGEAVLFKNKKIAKNFEYYRKQGMQLSSKMRYISAQFIEYFKNDLWYENAKNSNDMAKYFFEKLSTFDQIEITHPVESNAIFAKIAPKYIKLMQDKNYFYIWDEKNNEVRIMTSFDTNKTEIDNFINHTKGLII